MRILFFNYEYPPLGGGAANATAAIMREFSANSEVEVDIVTSSVDGHYRRQNLGEHIHIHFLPIGKNPKNITFQSHKDLLVYSWKAWRFAVRLVKKHHYDGVHAFFTVPCGFIALLLKWKFGLPYIVSLRGSDVPGYSQRFRFLYPFIRPIVVFVWRRATAVIANSRGLRELARQSNPKQMIGIISNGIDTDMFRRRASALRDERAFTILCASRLSRRKGFRYAIEAFALLAKKYPHVRLFIAGGEGDAEAELREQVRALHLGNDVTFFGYVKHAEFPSYYNAADVFVFPSLNEGMSNSLLEALASSLPVIVTPTGGADELVEEGKNGYVVPFEDSKAIVQRLELLVNNKKKAEKMGWESRVIAERMSWGAVAQAYIDIYHQHFEKS